MENCKFLVSGDVKGKFKLLFSKVEKSVKKCGPFAFLLCTGSFFGEEENGSDWNQYILKPENIPIHVYILGPNSQNEAKFYNSVQKTSSINEKITFVGKSGIFTTCEGIKVAYISGLETSNAFLSITESDIKNLTSKEGTVDIIFTSQWPVKITDEGITDYKPKLSSKLVFKLFKTLKPRYFFSGFENKYYERLPLCHIGEVGNVEYLTRFVGLAFVGNHKEKWLYAVNMNLQRKLSTFDTSKLSLYLKHQPQYQQSVSDIPLENINSKDQKKKFKTNRSYISKKLNIEGNCWFCLSTEDPQNHLIINVGMNVYLALCKGGLVQDHMCLVPIDHVSSVSQADIDIRKELHYFENALKVHYKKKKKVIIFYERFYKTSHAQINCIPMREDLARNVKTSFMERAAEIGMDLTVCSSQDVFTHIISGDEYFRVELADGEELFCKILPQSDFSLNFGREALVKNGVFNCPEKASWKKCLLEPEEEKCIVNRLRKEFKFK